VSALMHTPYPGGDQLSPPIVVCVAPVSEHANDISVLIQISDGESVLLVFDEMRPRELVAPGRGERELAAQSATTIAGG
jgi:hypothetical protein